MAESDCIDDFAKRMRPMTANEVIAIRRNKLCSNKHERNMKYMRRASAQNVNQLIKSQFSIEYALNNIREFDICLLSFSHIDLYFLFIFLRK